MHISEKIFSNHWKITTTPKKFKSSDSSKSVSHKPHIKQEYKENSIQRKIHNHQRPLILVKPTWKIVWFPVVWSRYFQYYSYFIELQEFCWTFTGNSLLIVAKESMDSSGISDLMSLLLDLDKFKMLFHNLPWGSSTSSPKQANKELKLAWNWAAFLLH